MARTGTTDTYFLFENQTTDANSTAVQVNYPSKTAVVKAVGTFDGASLKFQTTFPQSSTWIDIPDYSGAVLALEDPGQRALLYLVQNEQVRAVLTGSGASTNISVSLEIT